MKNLKNQEVYLPEETLVSSKQHEKKEKKIMSKNAAKIVFNKPTLLENETYCLPSLTIDFTLF